MLLKDDYGDTRYVLDDMSRIRRETGADSHRVEMPNGTGNFRNFQISRRKDNLERWTEIVETNFRKPSVPFDFKPEFSKILVEWNAPTVFIISLRSERSLLQSADC